MDEELLLRITGFFNCWRNRALFIRNLDHQINNYEANILIWSCLDALSNFWAKEIGKDKCKNFSESKRQIFDEFLSYYYPDVFNQVSLPHIWHRTDIDEDEEKIFLGVKKISFKLPDDVAVFLQNLHKKNQSTELEIGSRKHRNISDDLPIDIVLGELKFKCNTKKEELAKIRRWLKFSRYGAIAYQQMRSFYIHEGQAGKETHGFELYESELRPTYLSYVYTTPPKMGFSVKFMLEVLSKCIASFEKEAIELQQDPAPNKDTKKSKE